MKYDAIVVASGVGSRANLGYNKVFYKLDDGKTILDHSLSLFIEDKDCQKVILVLNESDYSTYDCVNKIIKTIGGLERKDSVQSGLVLVDSDYVLIHDGARPYLKKDSLEKLKNKLNEYDACILGRYATDTIKYVEDGVIKKTIDRNNIFLAETPQGFKTELIKKCYEKSKDLMFTDDASLVENLGYSVYVVEDEYGNKKYTYSKDFNYD